METARQSQLEMSTCQNKKNDTSVDFTYSVPTCSELSDSRTVVVYFDIIMMSHLLSHCSERGIRFGLSGDSLSQDSFRLLNFRPLHLHL